MSAITLHPATSNLLVQMIAHTLANWGQRLKAAQAAAVQRREERELIQMIQTYEQSMPAFAADLRAALARRN